MGHLTTRKSCMELPLITAEAPRDVLSAMAESLGRVRDVWARHWLILPGKGRAEWVQQEWARRSGIASRSQTMAVRALVELAAAGGERQGAFSAEALALAVAGLIPQYAEQLPLAQPPPANAPIDGLMLAWGRQLADALDTGLLCRAQASERFADAPFLAALAEDQSLQEILASHLGCMSEDAFRQQCQAFMAHWQGREGLPYLWIHLDGGLPEVLWQRLMLLLSLWPRERVRVFALSPSLQFWADLRTGRQASVENPGPLLQAFGRRAQDLQEQLSPLFDQGTGGVELPSPETGSSLLGRLQASCRDLAVPQEPQPLAEDDVSLSVHGCRSPLRELEGIRDRIIQTLAAQPHLSPDDVLVLLADPATHAPLVAAAFAAAGDRQQHLPFRLTTGQGSQPAALSDAITALWTVMCGRCDQEAVLQVLESPLIRQRFNLQDYDGSTLLQWLSDARFSWGMDAQQRQQQQGPLGDRAHLAFALRRLAWGAVADPRQQSVLGDGVVPLDRASGLATAALADLGQLIHTLADQRQYWVDHHGNEPQPASSRQWCRRLEQLVEACIAADEGLAQQQHGQLLHRILPQLRQHLPDDLPMLGSAFRRLVLAQLEELHHQFGSGGGGVCVGALREWAGRPAAVVAICGLSDGLFPRSDERPGWHPLAAQRRPGDAGRRDDDRHALLLALLAAEEQLICTYESGSLYDGNERPPSTPLVDLLAAAKACAPAQNHDRLWQRHALNGFAPQSIARHTPSWARSSAAHDYAAGAAVLAARRQPQPGHGLWRRAAPSAPQAWRWKDLLAVAKEPVQGYIRHLGLRLPEESTALHSVESFTLDGLEQWQQRDRLLRFIREGGDRDSLQHLQGCAGILGPGLFAEQQWQAIQARLPKPEHLALAGTAIDSDCRSLATTLPIEGNHKYAWYADEQGCLAFNASKQGPPKKKEAGAPMPVAESLATVLEMLALAAGGHSGQARVYCCGSSDGPGSVLSWNLPPADAARAALDAWCALAGQACRVPIAWTPGIHQIIVSQAKHGESFAQDERSELLNQCNEAWVSGGFQQASPSESPAARLALRGLADPCSWMGPEGLDAQPLALPHPHLCLTMRWCLALEDWFHQHIAPGPQENLP
ncbi:MAG: hypothetical protein EA401_06595 [Planctomycetota bacterium]|nr:MAG: hypothetical protein EA401_06595 [Planctomycetota bacterium]